MVEFTMSSECALSFFHTYGCTCFPYLEYCIARANKYYAVALHHVSYIEDSKS